MAEQPALVLPNFPYKGAFTKQQLDAALDRKDWLVDAMMDAVGPDGTVITIPVDMLHILAFHLALVEEDLIEYRVRPSESGMYMDAREWRPKGRFGDEPPPPTDEQAKTEAQELAAQLKRQSTPEVRAALAAIMADEYDAHTSRSEMSRREKAENVLMETRIPKGGDE